MQIKLQQLLKLIVITNTLALVTSLHGGTKSDLATKRLLDISKREQKIYEQIAVDPHYYSAEDLEQQLNKLILSYSNYLSNNPEDVSALILYGKLLRRVGKNDQAFRAFLKADELDPKIAVVKQQIGNHLAETGNGKAAFTFYFNAIELEPDVPVYHYALGEILYTFRDQFIEENIFTRDAIDREMFKAFQTVTQLEPDNFNAQMRLGEAYYDMENPNWKNALLHWEKLREATPIDSSLSCQILDLHRTRALCKLGRMVEAEALAKTITHSSLQQSKQKVLNEKRKQESYRWFFELSKQIDL